MESNSSTKTKNLRKKHLSSKRIERRYQNHRDELLDHIAK